MVATLIADRILGLHRRGCLPNAILVARQGAKSRWGGAPAGRPAVRLIHRGVSDDIYLVSRKRLSGYHVELRSYALYCELQTRAKEVMPRLDYRYKETYDETKPGLVVHVDGRDLLVTYGSGSWSCEGPAGEIALPVALVEFMEARSFNESKG